MIEVMSFVVHRPSGPSGSCHLFEINCQFDPVSTTQCFAMVEAGAVDITITHETESHQEEIDRMSLKSDPGASSTLSMY
jgi:hypothetical protein